MSFVLLKERQGVEAKALTSFFHLSNQCLLNSYNVLGFVADIRDAEIKDTVPAHRNA